MMKKVIEKLCDGVAKELGMIVALVLLAMPPMLFHPVFFGGLHSGLVNGFDAELWQQLKYPVIDMGLLMLMVLVVVEIVHWIGKQWVKWIVYGIAIALTTARIWLWWVFRLRISPSTLMLLFETNSQESSEFVQVYLLGWYGIGLIGIVVGLVGLCWFFEWVNRRFELSGVWRKIAVYLSIVCLIWGMIEMKWVVKLVECEESEDVFAWKRETCYDDYSYSAFNVQAILYSVICNKCIAGDIYQCGHTACGIEIRKNEVVCDNDSLVVVFVLGESYIKNHCGLYGYERNTTPLLAKENEEGRLYLFKDVIAPYTLTTDAVKTLFFTNDNSEIWYKEAFFLQLFKMAGFEVDMWDNQLFDKANTTITFGMFAVLYNEKLRKRSYSNICDSHFTFDAALVDDYKDKSFDSDGNRLIIFHLMGQHLDAAGRFPHTEDNLVFKGTDERSEKIAMYDNACVYNDKVVTKIIDLVRDKKSVVVYLSDHGEEVYDYRDCYGRWNAEPGMEKEFLKYQAEVPFMIWCSDKYKEAYPEIIEDIKASVDKPFITDNVCQVMFHLAGLKSPWYNEERDLLSDKYKCGNRIVNGMYDYDEIMGRK